MGALARDELQQTYDFQTIEAGIEAAEERRKNDAKIKSIFVKEKKKVDKKPVKEPKTNFKAPKKSSKLSRKELRKKENTVDLTEDSPPPSIDLTLEMSSDEPDKEEDLKEEHGLPVLYPNFNHKINQQDQDTYQSFQEEMEAKKRKEQREKARFERELRRKSREATKKLKRKFDDSLKKAHNFTGENPDMIDIDNGIIPSADVVHQNQRPVELTSFLNPEEQEFK